MIDVKSLEMTADKSRYFVRRGELEETLYRLKAAEDALAIAEHYRDTFRRDACAEAGRLESAERERDHFKALAESRWDGAVESNQRADALATENRKLKSRGAWLDGEREALIKQKNALAAHVERLREAFRATIDSDWSLPMEEALEEALDDDAAASLARRDALKQAEGADLFADDWGWGEFRPDESDVRKWAEETYRQAEAHK